MKRLARVLSFHFNRLPVHLDFYIAPLSVQRTLSKMYSSTLLLSLLTAGSTLVSAFPASSEAATSLDILTGRAIGSACSTPVFRSCPLHFQR